MSRKILYTLTLFLLFAFTFTFCLATDQNPVQEATNSVKNVVGGAENSIENGVKDIGNMTKEGTNSIEKGMNNAGNELKSSTSKIENNQNSYVATRTSTDGTATFMGMNATTWTWLIIGIAAIAIVALVWYYSSQITNNSNNRRL